MSMFKSSKIYLVISNELLAKINREIDCLSGGKYFFLEYVFETRFRFSFNLNLLFKFFHCESSILFQFY